MAAFRKVFLALVVVALAAATASAQVICTGGASPKIVRTEGLTELLGDIVLSCNITAGTPASSFNIQVTLNTNATSPFGGTGDPQVDAVLVVTQALATPIRGIKASDTTVSFLSVPIAASPLASTATIQISNLRGNASGLAVGSAITAFVSSSGGGATTLTISNNTFTVGSTSSSVTFRARNTINDTTQAFTGLQCAATNGDLFSDATKTNQTLSGNLQFQEQQQSAFKTAADEVGNYTAAGFGAVTNGTRLKATFNNVPANVALFVTTRDVENGTTAFAAAAKAVLVGADSTGAGGTATAYTEVDAGCLALTAACGPAGSGGDARVSSTVLRRYRIQQLTVSNGSATAVWEIVSTNANAAEDISFGFATAFKAGQPALGTATVNGGLAPISTVKLPAVLSTPPAGQPVPRFADTSSATNVFTLNPCATNLLFPYVTNQAGFDTGLVVSNTSSDPFGTSGQAGTCTLNYYGATTGGGAAPAAVTTQSVPAGGQLVWTLSSGGNLGATATPGFQGYVIAQCQFRFGHGFAFVSDVGARNLAMGYLPLVMDGDGIATSLGAKRDTKTNGEIFGN